MTGYESKRAAARDKLDDDDTQVYHSEVVLNMAQPAQEPVAWLCKPDKHGLFGLPTADKACKDCFPVYTAPPQRPWVGLTEQEFQLIYDMGRTPSGMMEMVETMLKERNT